MSTYEISKSSLLSLKAEILRKQQELGKAKADNEVKIKNIKKNSPLDLKNKGVEQRLLQDISEEDEDLLKKSRDALEAKSRLYDKLSKGTLKLSPAQEEYYRRYLVRFDRKSRVPDLPPEETEDDVDRYPSEEEEDIINDSYEPPKNREEEWVEYVDCLGRTRTCLRKDLDYLKSKDKDLKLIVESKRRKRQENGERSPSPPPQPKEKTPEPEVSEETELLSSDMRREILRRQWEKEEEELRNKKDIHYQDILFNEARSHGVGYYSFSKDEEERAKQQEALKKLRKETQEQQRKAQEMKAMREKQLAARIRAAKNRKRERMGLPPLEDEPEPEPQPEEPVDKTAEKVDETEKKLEEKRKKHVRPWDIGKEGVKEHYEYSQEEWVEKKRKERPDEFAPPSSYSRERRGRERRSDDRRSEKDDKRKDYERPKTDKKERQFEAMPIVNELSDDEDSLLKDYRFVNKATSKRGVEIAPPPTYDYYGPAPTKRTRKDSDASNVSESIEAGLRFLREQIEKKQTSRRSEDIFLS